jgi:hypothetical protein
MTISNPRYVWLGRKGQILAKGPGIPALIVTLNGFRTTIPWPQKWISLGLEIADLGSEWNARLPEIRVPYLEREQDGGFRVPGLTRDAKIVALVKRFVQDVAGEKFAAGPVA